MLAPIVLTYANTHRKVFDIHPELPLQQIQTPDFQYPSTPFLKKHPSPPLSVLTDKDMARDQQTDENTTFRLPVLVTE